MFKHKIFEIILFLLKKSGVKNDLFEYKCYDGYKTSKAGIHALTRLQQKELNKSIQGVIVSSVNPGDVKTDMNQGGNLTPDQGIIYEF